MTYRELASLFMAPFGLTVLGGETVPVSSHPCRFQVQVPPPPPLFLSVGSVSHRRLGRGRSRRLPLRGVNWNGSSQLGDQRASLAVHARHCFLMFFRARLQQKTRARRHQWLSSFLPAPRLKPPSAEFQTSTLVDVFFSFSVLFICLIASFSAGVPLRVCVWVCLHLCASACVSASSCIFLSPSFLRATPPSLFPPYTRAAHWRPFF